MRKGIVTFEHIVKIIEKWQVIFDAFKKIVDLLGETRFIYTIQEKGKLRFFSFFWLVLHSSFRYRIGKGETHRSVSW